MGIRLTEPKLNPNSAYHALLIKEYGVQGAKNVLKASSMAYSMDTVSQLKVRKYMAKPFGKK